MDSRLDRFRSYFDRLDPASTPAALLSDDRYADPPGRAIGLQLASRLQLAPTSSHLVTGAVGTGKTTQLYRGAESLRAAGDTCARYVDVSRKHDLDSDLGGVLIVLAGLELAKIVKGDADDVKRARDSFRRWAYGHREFIPHDPRDDDEYHDDYDPGDEEPGYWKSHQGLIAPPLSPLPAETREKVDELRVLMKALPQGIRHFVILFDSLDRLDDAEAFRRAAIDDVRALKAAGVGVAVVGPMRLLYGPNRAIADVFDQTHIAPALDVQEGHEGRDFLRRVLTKRTDEMLVGPDVREKIVTASGGLLRDLLQLTRSAVEEAFVSEADSVTSEHLARAVDDFGRTMMYGLRPNEIDTLDLLRRRGTFVPTDDDSIALLVSRRVIEYAGRSRRYAVHPAIEPLVALLGRSK